MNSELHTGGKKMLFSLILLLLISYVAIPSPDFPKLPPDAVQSLEEGDMEATYVKRAYFTNFTRTEVLDYYQKEFSVTIFGLSLPSYRLNYPPEDAQTLIRDQTRSTFLEEIVHPLRESFFVNGLEPKDPKDDIWYKGIHYRQKITVKYLKSNVFVRLMVISISIPFLGLLLRDIIKTLKNG